MRVLFVWSVMRCPHVLQMFVMMVSMFEGTEIVTATVHSLGDRKLKLKSANTPQNHFLSAYAEDLASDFSPTYTPICSEQVDLFTALSLWLLSQ